MKTIISILPKKGIGRLIFFLSVSLMACACQLNGSSNEKSKLQSVKILNWNLQTFFDGQFDGNEYNEYRSSKNGWCLEKYEVRLERLASVLKNLDADVVIMEEIEKEEQLKDITNRLCGTFDFKKLYSYQFFAKHGSDSIGCGVLSRFPLGKVLVHEIDNRLGKKQPPMRPIIQFTLYVKDSCLTVFVNHWKSKSGGAEKSESWRLMQEKQLANLMIKASRHNSPVLACGDFNKDIREFKRKSVDGKEYVILCGDDNLKVYSPWISDGGIIPDEGSYWYKNQWEKIDHFFSCGAILLCDFRAESKGEWAYEDGHPRRYQVWSGKGYSDHLPVSCTVRF